MSFEELLFYCVGAVAITTALIMVLHRNPVISAIALVGNFFCIALFYLLLHAQLLAVLQIVVYTGAIMVLVVFVIMLLNLKDEKRLTEKYDLKKIVGVVICAGFMLEMIWVFGFSDAGGIHPGAPVRLDEFGTVEHIGEAMFSRFLLPFEVTSLLLLAAIIGAVVLARREN